MTKDKPTIAEKILGLDKNAMGKIGEPIEVILEGKVRFGDDDYGNSIFSLNVLDKDGILPPTTKKTKRIVFATQEIFETLVNRGKDKGDSVSFEIPFVQPDKRGQYWIRSLPHWAK